MIAFWVQAHRLGSGAFTELVALCVDQSRKRNGKARWSDGCILVGTAGSTAFGVQNAKWYQIDATNAS